MKLHLPKNLFLAAMVSQTVWADWGAGSENNTYYVTGDVTDAWSTEASSSSSETIFMRAGAADITAEFTGGITISGTDSLRISGHWSNGNNFTLLTISSLTASGNTLYIGGSQSAAAEQVISIGSVEGSLGTLQIENKATLTLGGEVTINDALKVNEGGVLNLNGTITGSGTITNSGTINISSDSSVSTGSAIQNSGTVVLQQGSEDIVLYNLVGKNYGVYNPSVIANTATGNIVIENTGNKTIGDGITIANGGKITLSGGTFGTSTAGLSSTIKTENDTILAFENISVYIGGGDSSNQMLDADMIVGDGAMLTMSVGDRYHYNNKHTLEVLTGGSVVLGSTRQTLAAGFELILAGGTVTGEGDSSHNIALDFYNGGTVKVTENSTLAAHTGGHDNDATITFDVADGKTLTMSGNLVKTAVTKTNSGTMVYQGAGFAKDLTIGAGTFEYNVAANQTITHTGAISGDGLLKKSGTGTLKYTNSSLIGNLSIEGGIFDFNNSEDIEHTGTISGTGTFQKSGAGTLTLSSANTTVTGLSVIGGKLVYDVVEAGATHTLTGTDADAVFEKTGAGTLALGNLSDYSYSGSLLVSEGKVTFTGSNTEDTSDSRAPRFVTLVNNLTTTGDAEVEISGNVIFNYQQTSEAASVITLDSHISVTGNLEINSYESENAPDGDDMRRWNVVEGAALNVAGHLWLTNDQKMVVSGGDVVAAGGVKLGHSENNANGNHHSKLVIESGSVTTTGVTFCGGDNNVVMTEGELTFAPTTDGGAVLSGGSGTNSFTISGGTLKATDTSWALTGSTAYVVSLGNVTFDIAAEKQITLAGDITLTGALNRAGEGTLTFGDSTLNMTSAALYQLSYTIQNVATDSNGVGEISYHVFTGNGGSALADDASVVFKVDGNTTENQFDVSSGLYTIGELFVVNTEFSTADATTDNGAVGAAGFFVNSDGKFTIAGNITDGLKVHELLTGTLGTGKIIIGTTGLDTSNGSDYNLTTAFTGTLELAENVTFTLGNGTNDAYSQGASINTDSLSGLVLNNGSKLQYNADGNTNIANVQVVDEAAATIHFKDSQSANAVQLTGKTQLDGNLTLSSTWDGGININALVGDGTLTGSSGTEDFNTTIGSLIYTEDEVTSTFSGTMEFSGDSNTVSVSTGTGADVVLNKLSATGVAAFTLDVETNTTIHQLDAATGTVNMAEGTTLTLGDGESAQNAKIGSLVASGNTVYLSQYTTLTLGDGQTAQTSSIGTLVAHSSGNTVHLNQNATLIAFTKGTDSGTITLTGSGVYDLGSGNKTVNVSGLTDSTNWTGKVKLSSVALSSENFAGYGNTASTIWLENVTGNWSQANNTSQTYAYNYYLTNGENGYAYGQDNGWGGDYRIISGSVSGDGNWGRIDSKGTGQTWEFAGDVSGWTGKIFNNVTSTDADRYTTYKFTGDGADGAAAIVNVSIANKNVDSDGEFTGNTVANDLNVEFNNTNGFVVNGTIDATNVTVNSNSTFNEAVSATQQVAIGNEKKAEFSNLSVGGLKISATSSESKATATAIGEQSLIALKEGTSYSIQDVTFANATLSTEVADAYIQMQNVSGNVVLSGGTYEFNAVIETEPTAAATTTSTLNYEVQGAPQITLGTASTQVVLTADPAEDCGQIPGVYDLVFKLSLTLAEGLTEANVDWAEVVTFGGPLATLLEEQNATLGTVATFALTENPYVFYEYNADTSLLTVTVQGITAPEPTTATLSLLALAALAARRRRR